jgi:hypothetical protein
MSLPTLEWKKLPIVTTSTSSSVSTFLNLISNMLTGSTYFDGSARTIGVGSAWSSSRVYITGSNTEAILCYPPLITEMSQSVLFVGKSTTGGVSGGTPTMSTGDTALGTNSIGIGLSKNSSNFTNWTGSLPMGAGSSFAGYTTLLSNVTGSAGTYKITMYESKETLAITIGTPSNGPTNNRCLLIGALIDPQQTGSSVEAESDNRIYGHIRSTNSTTGFPGFYENSPSFLDHNNTAASDKHVFFNPGQSSLLTGNAMKINATVGAALMPVFLSISSKLVKLPLYFNQGNASFIGTLRDTYMVRDFTNNLVIRDASSNVVGFTISTSEMTADNTIFLSYT